MNNGGRDLIGLARRCFVMEAQGIEPWSE